MKKEKPTCKSCGTEVYCHKCSNVYQEWERQKRLLREKEGYNERTGPLFTGGLKMAEIKSIETPYGQEKVCAKCGGIVDWIECDGCDEDGLSYHDCGEDTCCCLHPENNVTCDWCNGVGGHWRCSGCDKRHSDTNSK